MIAKEAGGYSLRVSEQAWDSETFGFTCGLFEAIRTRPDQRDDDGLVAAVADVLGAARANGFRFLTLRTDAADIALFDAAVQNAGSLIGTEITFSKARDRRALESGAPPHGYAIEKHDRYWNPSLVELADTLTDSRFFVDRHIGADLARKAWRTSIYNNCTGRASYSIVCSHGERAIGLMNVFEREDVSDVFLVAVAPAHQHKGIGRAMWDLYERCLDARIASQVVDTQLINYGAQRLYVGRGYRAQKSKHIVHFWL